MNTRIFNLSALVGAATATLIFTGCDPDLSADESFELEVTPGEVGEGQSAGMGESAIAAPLTDSELESAWIGIDTKCMEANMPIIARVNTDVDCAFPEMPGNWTAERLYEASPWITAAMAAEPLPLDSPYLEFCKYEYDGNDPTSDYPGFMTALRRDPSVIDPYSAATDCPSVYPLAGLDSPDVLDAARETFLDSVDAVDADDLDGIDTQASHIYLLDTAQNNGLAFAAYDPHSDALRELVTKLYCPEDRPGCQGEVHQFMVTPRRFGNDNYATPDYFQGGNKGCAYELSMGIVTAVLDLREINDDSDLSTLERGVINASVGAAQTGTYATDVNYAPMQSVIEASRMAACAGIPIYAAAGNGKPNDVGCVGGEGMMFPAALDSFDAPSPAQCAAWGYVPMADTTAFPIDLDSGIVTPVGGLDHHDGELPNDRIDAHPAHAAPGFYALGPNDEMPRTGTSIAAAAYSATAALAWAIEPDISPESLTELMYERGHDAGFADAGRLLNEPRKRLSVCGTLQEILGLDCVAEPPNPLANEAFATATLSAVTAAQLSGDLISIADPQPVEPLICEGVSYTDLFAPLPERPGCASCSVGEDIKPNGDDALEMTITDIAVPLAASVSKAALYTTDSLGNVTLTKLSPAVVAEINLADPTKVIEVVFDVSEITTATLDIHYTDATGNYVVSNPLWVFPPPAI